MISSQDKLELLETLRRTPTMLSAFIKTITEDKMNVRRGEEFWTIAEHVVHLAEVQPMLLTRFQRFVTEDNPEFIPYIPKENIEEPVSHPRISVAEALEMFSEYRRKEIELLKDTDNTVWKKIGLHPEYELYSMEILARHVLLHDYWHMYRIEALWLTRDAYLTKF